jgi:2-methylcitrate dehydratase PrpD
MHREPISRRLAEFLAAARYSDLPPAVVAEAKRAILDWLGSALAGALEPPAEMARCVIARLGTSAEAKVFGDGRASAAAAALANGVASHILELDDVHKGSTLHGAAPVIPAALAVAEREHADGKAFVLAVALGYEAALRVGEAVNPSHYRYWHPTGTAGTFGAAAAAGSLVALDADRMLDALGSAGTQAAGLWEFNADGAMSKHLHPGKAAFNGVLSADLARVGFTGASRILEGDRGFFAATSASHDESRITDGLGTTWKILENCYKLHSCCGHTHSAIDVAVDIRTTRRWSDRHAATEIDSIDIETYGPGYEIVKEMNPRTPYQAKFSIAYGVAVGLLEGAAALAQFAPDRFGETGVRDGDIAALLKRTHVTVADDLTAKYPAAWPTRVRSHCTTEGTVSGASDFPRGNPGESGFD